ncbi:MAG: Gfo/Idh/MocA family oxidoreductase [Micrococcales bacterium]|nr:Gfo/Idh/MocA family oxidoreductase [Micrococcales bacterium]
MKELKVALVGAGFMGRAHSLAYALAPIASELGTTLVKQVLVDANPEVAVSAARQLGWAESATDWRDVVARDDIDIVDICTPPQFHAEIALAAIEAGKHVFCEKPITNDPAEARAIVAAAERAGVVTQVGYNYRHTPAVSYAKKLLDEGRLGTPLQFRASYCQEVGFWADPNRWRALKATGGSGTVGDIGSHIIDLAEHLFGDIVRVAARARSFDGEGWRPDAERVAGDLIDDAAVWLAEFANGAIGTFSVSQYAIGRKNRVYFEFDASRAAVQFDWNDREVFRVAYVDEPADHRGFRAIHTNDQHPDGWWRLAGLGTGYPDVSAIQMQHFVRAIVDGTPTAPDFARAAHVEEVVAAVYRAAQSDRWVEVGGDGTHA